MKNDPGSGIAISQHEFLNCLCCPDAETLGFPVERKREATSRVCSEDFDFILFLYNTLYLYFGNFIHAYNIF